MNNVTVKTNNEWFAPALFLLFLGLKLTGHIDWSWWWVTSPLWIPSVVVALMLVVMFLVLKFSNESGRYYRNRRIRGYLKSKGLLWM